MSHVGAHNANVTTTYSLIQDCNITVKEKFLCHVPGLFDWILAFGTETKNWLSQLLIGTTKNGRNQGGNEGTHGNKEKNRVKGWKVCYRREPTPTAAVIFQEDCQKLPLTFSHRKLPSNPSI